MTTPDYDAVVAECGDPTPIVAALNESVSRELPRVTGDPDE